MRKHLGNGRIPAMVITLALDSDRARETLLRTGQHMPQGNRVLPKALGFHPRHPRESGDPRGLKLDIWIPAGACPRESEYEVAVSSSTKLPV